MANRGEGKASSDAEVVFPGDSEMARRMRDLDWSNTPLGEVHSWPQSLRTAVSIMLASGYPMYIAWGRDYTEFYNDAFRPILGAKDPAALGNTSRQTWSEIWDFVGPLFESVVGEGKTVAASDQQLFVNRHGYLEEVYFDFSYSPVRVESGGVGGVFVTCSETTERVISERRLRTLRDLAAATSESGDTGMAWQNALAPLAANPFSVPFALVYERELDGVALSLVGSIGVAEVGLAVSAETLPLGAVFGGADLIEVVVPDELAAAAPGAWPESPPKTVVLMALAPTGPGRGPGVLAMGTNPRRPLDDSYREFLTLAGRQIAASMATARAFEQERRRAEALAEASRALQAGLAMSEQFTSLVSHELRNPIAIILGNAVLLQRRGVNLSEEIKNEIYGDMAVGARKLSDIVNGLLTLTRLEAGGSLDLLAVDLKALLIRAVEEFTARTPERQVEVAYRARSAVVEADEALLVEVIENLLTNALKYSPAGSPIAVTVDDGSTPGTVPGTVEVKVRDHGPGVHEAELEQIFEAFYRSPKSSGQVGGVGLGLAVCRRIVEAHGGSIRVENQPGGGAVFSFTLRTVSRE